MVHQPDIQWIRIDDLDHPKVRIIFDMSRPLYEGLFYLRHEEPWENFETYIKQNQIRRENARKAHKKIEVENYFLVGLVDDRPAGMLFLTAYHLLNKGVVWYAILDRSGDLHLGSYSSISWRNKYV